MVLNDLTYTWKDINFSVDQTEQFFNYIGDAPPGFAHKWP